MPVQSINSFESQLVLACERYCDLLIAGNAPDVDQFVNQYPEFKGILRPALLAAQSMRLVSNGIAGIQPGSKIGEFRIIRHIDSGGMGAVFEAEQITLGRRVALKLLSIGHAKVDQPTALIRFRNEGRAAAALNHPHIVPVYQVGSGNGHEFIAMQLIDGETWRKRIHTVFANSMQVTEVYRREVSSHVRDVAGALAHAHDCGVIHRDIKPQNLLIDSNGKTWISDFGLALLPSNQPLTLTGELVGTLRYMSPEQAANSGRRVDERSDIYSLGATFFEMLYGRPLLEPDSREEQLKALLQPSKHSQNVRCDDLPYDLATIVLTMTEFEPDDRYQSAQAVCDDLDKFLASRPIDATRIAWTLRALRWSQRRAVWLIVASIAAILTTTLLSFLSWSLYAARGEALKNQRLAEIAVKSETTHRQALETAEQQLKFQLQQSLVARAETKLLTGAPGQRFEPIDLLREAETVLSLEHDPNALKRADEIAFSANCLTDARIIKSFAKYSHPTSLDSCDFAPDLRYFTRHEGPVIQVLNGDETDSTNVAVAELPLTEYPMTVRFGSRGDQLAIVEEPEQDPLLTVWDWKKEKRAVTLQSKKIGSPLQRWALDLDEDQNKIVVGTKTGEVVIWDLQRDIETKRFQGVDCRVGMVRWSPDRRLLAASFPEARVVVVWDVANGQVKRQWELKEDLFAVAWSPDGEILAVGSGYDIFLFSMDSKSLPSERIFNGPSAVIAELRFHPSGRLLVAHGYDGKSRFWHVDSGKQRLEIDGHAGRFSVDGKRLSFRTTSQSGLWEIAFEDSTWHEHGHVTRRVEPQVVEFCDNGSILAVGGPRGLAIWDIQQRRLLSFESEVETLDLLWLSQSKSLLVITLKGLHEIDFRDLRSESPFGLAKSLDVSGGDPPQRIAATSDGRVIACSTKQGAGWLLFNRRDRITLCDDQERLNNLSISEDGHWLAAGRRNLGSFVRWKITPSIELPRDGAPGPNSTIVLSSMQRIKNSSTLSIHFLRLHGQLHILTGEANRYILWTCDDLEPQIARTYPRPDGYKIATSSIWQKHQCILASDYRTLELIDLQSQESLVKYNDPHQQGQITHVATDPETRQIAVALNTGGFSVFQLAPSRRSEAPKMAIKVLQP